MDAMPVRLDQTFSMRGRPTARTNIDNNSMYLESKTKQLAQGGTAVGTGINAPQNLLPLFCERLSGIYYKSHFHSSKNFFALNRFTRYCGGVIWSA